MAAGHRKLGKEGWTAIGLIRPSHPLVRASAFLLRYSADPHEPFRDPKMRLNVPPVPYPVVPVARRKVSSPTLSPRLHLHFHIHLHLDSAHLSSTSVSCVASLSLSFSFAGS